MDKKSLSERDICSKYIAPAVQSAGWDMHRQVREEVSFTKGRIIVNVKPHSRVRRADFVLYHQPNLPLAAIETNVHKLSEACRHTTGSGLQREAGADEHFRDYFFHLTPVSCT